MAGALLGCAHRGPPRVAADNPGAVHAALATLPVLAGDGPAIGPSSLIMASASWCVSCRAPLAQALARRGDPRLYILIVDYDPRWAQKELLRIARSAGPRPFTVLWDQGGATVQRLGLNRMPWTLVVGQTGLTSANPP